WSVMRYRLLGWNHPKQWERQRGSSTPTSCQHIGRSSRIQPIGSNASVTRRAQHVQGLFSQELQTGRLIGTASSPNKRTRDWMDGEGCEIDNGDFPRGTRPPCLTGV